MFSRIPTKYVLVVALLALARVAEAGPPLLCHPFNTGSARLLTWGTGQGPSTSLRAGWNTPARGYDVSRLTADTLQLLSPDAPVLVRMENLRRATIYASQDRQVAAELMSALLSRAMMATASGTRNSLAWFDAGYLIESYRQASGVALREMIQIGARASWTLREPEAIDGYLLVQKAIEMAGSNPEMEFAASLMKGGAVAAAHRRRAEAAAAKGSLLAENLRTH